MNTKFALFPRLIILTVLTIALAIGHPANANFVGIEGFIHADKEDIKSGYLLPTVGGITVSTISGPTTEAGGSATFTVVLTQAPAIGTSVIIAFSSSNPSEGNVTSTNPLVFDDTNWNIEKTVTVTGADDDVADGNVAYTIITAAAVSDDPEFSGVDPANVSVTNNDNDTAGITVSPTSGLTTTEAGPGTDSFSIVLT